MPAMIKITTFLMIKQQQLQKIGLLNKGYTKDSALILALDNMIKVTKTLGDLDCIEKIRESKELKESAIVVLTCFKGIDIKIGEELVHNLMLQEILNANINLTNKKPLESIDTTV